jgi:hypothetical protein
MTKNQRNMLELALIHVRLDNVLQGDSWGITYTDDTTADAAFKEIASDVYELREMADDALLEYASTLANVDIDDSEHLAGYEKVPTFESYGELWQYSRDNVDGGDLENQSVLDILYRQITEKEN